MERLRQPFQGVCNIVRFNWHFYALSLCLVMLLYLMSGALPATYRPYAAIAAVLLMGATLVSLIVSCYVYDLSGFYRMDWAGECAGGARIANIHAGFDETSALLQTKYPGCELIVLDFYDPTKHTEVSIRRARKACPAFPGTRSIDTSTVPLPDCSTDRVFLILSAHEIRNDDERSAFLRELRRALKPAGQIVVAEHLRNLPNFLAYTIGFFHFLPRAAWTRTFREAGLKIVREIKPNPFIITFILEKDGTAS